MAEFSQPGNVQGGFGPNPDDGHDRVHGHVCRGQRARPGAPGPVEADAQALGVTLRKTAASPGGIQLRLGQARARVPLPVRSGRRSQDFIRGLPGTWRPWAYPWTWSTWRSVSASPWPGPVAGRGLIEAGWEAVTLRKRGTPEEQFFVAAGLSLRLHRRDACGHRLIANEHPEVGAVPGRGRQGGKSDTKEKG